MAKQSAGLELFNHLYTELSKIGVPVIEMKDLQQELSYPFIVIDNITDDISRLTFDRYGGRPAANIHIWGKQEDKGAQDTILLQVQNVCFSTEHTAHYQLQLDALNVTSAQDNTTNQPLQHTTVLAEFLSY
ncbi:hypothetical protein [Mammaliicoccus sciuri]|uniref:hypothetical protein n=1 Tax=Mammaliicoccus sciuri TaxID=1296 RepID=UPI003A95B92D